MRHGLGEKTKQENRKTRISNHRAQSHMTQRCYRNEAPDRLTVSLQALGRLRRYRLYAFLNKDHSSATLACRREVEEDGVPAHPNIYLGLSSHGTVYSNAWWRVARTKGTTITRLDFSLCLRSAPVSVWDRGLLRQVSTDATTISTRPGRIDGPDGTCKQLISGWWWVIIYAAPVLAWVTVPEFPACFCAEASSVRRMRITVVLVQKHVDMCCTKRSVQEARLLLLHYAAARSSWSSMSWCSLWQNGPLGCRRVVTIGQSQEDQSLPQNNWKWLGFSTTEEFFWCYTPMDHRRWDHAFKIIMSFKPEVLRVC